MYDYIFILLFAEVFISCFYAYPAGFTSGISANDSQRQASAISASRNNNETSSSSAGTVFGRLTQRFAVPVSRNSAEPGISATDNQRIDFAVSASRNNAETSSSSAGTAFGTAASGTATQSFAVPVSRSSAEPYIQSAVQPPDRVSVPGHIYSPAMENMTPLESLKHGILVQYRLVRTDTNSRIFLDYLFNFS